ncbi:DUF2384 domain-containing protein [Vibrio splendidus]|uniref:DUF2384 domain-containing protein n=1 Tax=Vibrio splendidus TaxID=29497 RepID=A0AA43G2H7_VIBSP|nr:antitoxin Xre/MbcA/ParS toxin-binding domain-containing protein [Vibrio splendidus]MDH5923683.1 DUF2384 domain-containing protein [Vibrio splendidus]
MNQENRKNFDKVFSAALALFETEEAAHQWLEQPVLGLGNRRPIDMLSTSEDTKVVLDVIGRLEHGVFF